MLNLLSWHHLVRCRTAPARTAAATTILCCHVWCAAHAIIIISDSFSSLDPHYMHILQAPKNPITGQPLTPVTNARKDGYQATQGAGQASETHARIFDQLGAQPNGRSFGGEDRAANGLA